MDVKLIERAEKSFPKFSSLWIGIIIIGLCLIIIDTLFGTMLSSAVYKEILYVATFLIYFIVWLYFRKKLPRKKKGKIGLVLSIQSENDKQKIRIKNDFFEKLKELLKENNILESFDILFLK